MAARISAAVGDPAALLSLAIELAQENARLAGHAAALEQAQREHEETERARKDADAERKRLARGSRPRMSADVRGQDRTGADILDAPSPPSPSLLPPEPPNNSSPTPSPSGAQTIALRPSGPAPDVLAVLEHYRARHPRRKPGPKELTLIGKALSWGYSASDLREAIDGNADDPWHAEKGKHDLGYVLRDRGHIDDARAKHAAQSPVELRDGWFADVAS